MIYLISWYWGWLEYRMVLSFINIANPVEKLQKTIEKELSNENLDPEELVKEIGMSRSQLYRKIKALTNFSLAGFVRDYRLKRAMEMLQAGEHNVAEVVYLAGFGNRSYFHKVFVEKYQCTPNEARK